MNVTVQLGEPYWRTINAHTIELALPDQASAAMLLAVLCECYPALTPDLRDGEARPVIFVDDVAAQPDTLLHDGAQIHIVWPVSGG